jgi:hypothetical protein
MYNFSSFFDNDNNSSFFSNSMNLFDFNNNDNYMKIDERDQDAFISQSIFYNPGENLKENITRTKPTSFITQDSKKIYNDNKQSFESIQITIKEIEPKEKENLLGKKRGRKSKSEKIKGNHTRDNKDNIIKKIKVSCFNYIHKILNDSLRFTYKKFLNLNTKFKEDLKKDSNTKLMSMTIKEIYEEIIPAKRYDISNEDVKNKNKLLIKEIMDKNEERETIKILNTKFIDLFKQEETKKHIINEIMKKEKKEKIENDFGNLDDYLEKVKGCLQSYESWFSEKRGRNRHNRLDN